MDKVLIYRYFGGLPELMAAYGREGDFWPSVDEFIGDAEELRRLSPSKMMSCILRNYVEAIRKRQVTLEIMTWEVVERNELTAILEDIREITIRRLFEAVDKELNVRLNVDLPAFTALLGGGLTYLLIRSHNGTPEFNGVDLKSENGWARLYDSLDQISELVIKG